MNTITCTKCGNVIEVAQALEEEARKSIEMKVKAQSKKEIEELEKNAEEMVTKKLTQRYELENKQRVVESEENRKQTQELRTQLLELTKQLSQERTKGQNIELEMQKKLLESQNRLFADAKEKAKEEHKMVEAELRKKLDDAAKANEDLNRKLHQGSQQLQGEVQELDLEKSLAHEFPDDEIQPVGKGVLGADIRQIVKSPKGLECGKILWESKRTKAWSDGWTTKLKSDLIADRSHIPVIVSEVLPDEAVGGLGNKNGVWIASPKYAIILSALLRKSLLDAAKQKVIAQMKQTKAEELYGYVTSDEFVHQMESMIETYKEMKKQIDDERSAFDRMWKKREVQVNRLLSGASGMFGEMQGIAGTALPTISSLGLPDGQKE
jgi:hypothetical protein